MCIIEDVQQFSWGAITVCLQITIMLCVGGVIQSCFTCFTTHFSKHCEFLKFARRFKVFAFNFWSSLKIKVYVEKWLLYYSILILCFQSILLNYHDKKISLYFGSHNLSMTLKLFIFHPIINCIWWYLAHYIQCAIERAWFRV